MGSVEYDTMVHLEKQAQSERDYESAREQLEAEALSEIADDLMCGRTHKYVSAGDFLAEQLDEDELANILTVFLYGSAQDKSDLALRFHPRVEEGLKDWLRAKHERLIEDLAEQLFWSEP